MGRIALVTGATGFVGGHLAERLSRSGWTVRALVRSTSDTAHLRALGAELFTGSLDDQPAIREAADAADTVFHLAALNFGRSEEEFVRANVRGTRNVAEAIAGAARRPRRLVHLSSYAACGPSAGAPRGLDDPPAPLTAYGRTKLGAETEARAAGERGVEVVVIRAPAVYGPGDRALLPYFRLVRWGLAPLPSGGERRLHMIYVEDLAEALVRAAEVPPGTYPVAEPVQHAWEELVGTIARVMGRRPLRLPLPPALVRSAAAVAEGAGRLVGQAVGFNREKAEEMLAAAWTCDLSGSDALLPAAAATPLEAGLASTVRWYRSKGWL